MWHHLAAALDVICTVEVCAHTVKGIWPFMKRKAVLPKTDGLPIAWVALPSGTPL